MIYILPLKATDVWLTTLAVLIERGTLVSPRGQPCFEIMGYQTKIDMTWPCVASKTRKLSPNFMAGEAAWILRGDNRVETIAYLAPSIQQFSDDGKTFFGAYGPKVSAQIDYVVDALRRDPYSRQAVLNIWRENPAPTKDYPCTLSAQFMLRDGRIHCFDTMRSSDIWLGWPYDVFNFTMLAAVIALRLGCIGGIPVKLGTLTLTAGSQHLYARNLEKAKEVLKCPDVTVVKPVRLEEFVNDDQLINHLEYCAGALLWESDPHVRPQLMREFYE